MRYSKRNILIVLAIGLPFFGKAQTIQPVDTMFSRILDSNPRYFKRHDTVWISSGICQTLKLTMLTGEQASAFLNKASKVKPRLLTIHGNLQYDYTYRSLVDTPFSQRDFSQHTVQTTFDVTIREQYPVRVTLMTRQSNSPYFNDMTDARVEFNQRQFLQQAKSKLSTQLPTTLNKSKLTEIEKRYMQKKWEVEALQRWTSDPMRLQEIVEAKEKQAADKLMALALSQDTLERLTGESPSTSSSSDQRYEFKKSLAALNRAYEKYKDSLHAKADSLKTDNKPNLSNDIASSYQEKKQDLEKALKELKGFEGKMKAEEKKLADSITDLRKQLSKINAPAELKSFVRDHNLNAKDLPRGWKTLSMIQSIGIGRSWLDYSELTVKNISISGINLELNPGKFYVAAAAGKINYRFRDFVVKNNQQPRQSLYLIRAGIGKKLGDNLIFTWYDGKRNLLNSFPGTAIISKPERVLGMSVEARLQVNANNYVVLESAKSSFQTASQESKLVRKVWDFTNRRNEAFSIKLYSYWPGSTTRVSGYYRKMGSQFQSFNLQPLGVIQEAFQLKLQQAVWKKRLMLEAGIRKNDFSNPLITPGIASKTIFKSFQATLRSPRFPFVSLGYFPSSQLTILENNIIAENQYNTLSGVVSHVYRVGKLRMSTSAVGQKFFNHSADTGFIYYNASSVTLNHFVFLKNLQLQSGLTLTQQRDLHVTTVEQSLVYQCRDWLSLSGGLKHNRLNGLQTLWGAAGGMTIMIKKLGCAQISYDKSYLPGTARNLLPVKMGRVTYYRVF